MDTRVSAPPGMGQVTCVGPLGGRILPGLLTPHITWAGRILCHGPELGNVANKIQSEFISVSLTLLAHSAP